jgi:hypothetical protein
MTCPTLELLSAQCIACSTIAAIDKLLCYYYKTANAAVSYCYCIAEVTWAIYCIHSHQAPYRLLCSPRSVLSKVLLQFLKQILLFHSNAAAARHPNQPFTLIMLWPLYIKLVHALITWHDSTATAAHSQQFRHSSALRLSPPPLTSSPSRFAAAGHF